MVELAGGVALGISAFVGIGAGLLTYASQRSRARSRRFAHMLGLHQQGPSAAKRALLASWSLIRQRGEEISRTLIAKQVAARRLATIAIILGAVGALMSGEIAWCLLVVTAVGALIWLHK